MQQQTKRQEECEAPAGPRMERSADMGVPSDWRKAPQGGAPTVISLFAGCGGSSLGYRMAGFRELLAVDFDAHACEVFALNFPDVPVWRRDLTKVKGTEIMRFCGIKKGDLDVLDGSPPCQGFSVAGKRRILDPRNDLFRHFVRLIRSLSPKVFIMENVMGMVKGRMRGRFIEVMTALKGLPYLVECRKLNAMWYGVPQSRERLFWVGVAKITNKKPAFPKHTLKRPLTVVDTLKVDGFFLYRNSWDKEKRNIAMSSFKKPSFTICASTNMFAVVFSKNKPSATILKNCHRWSNRSIIGRETLLTIPQVKHLCSFPQDFELLGKYEQQWALLGNSVMPLQMKAIAETIKTEILNNGAAT